jgi:hypothetical protein
MIKAPRLSELEQREGWEARWQLTLIEPAESAPAYVGVTTTRPRRNLVLSSSPAQEPDALAAAESFLEQTKRAVPGLKIDLGPEKIDFKDEHPGARVDISFSATPEVRLLQTHLFRIDDQVVTQLVVTCDDQPDEGQRQELIDCALRFKPTPEQG